MYCTSQPIFTARCSIPHTTAGPALLGTQGWKPAWKPEQDPSIPSSLAGHGGTAMPTPNSSTPEDKETAPSPLSPAPTQVLLLCPHGERCSNKSTWCCRINHCHSPARFTHTSAQQEQCRALSLQKYFSNIHITNLTSKVLKEKLLSDDIPGSASTEHKQKG